MSNPAPLSSGPISHGTGVGAIASPLAKQKRLAHAVAGSPSPSLSHSGSCYSPGLASSPPSGQRLPRTWQSQGTIHSEHELYKDVEEGDDFQDALGGSPDVQDAATLAPSSPEPPSADWDEAEFQRLAADRSSRYSADTKFDDEDGVEADSDVCQEEGSSEHQRTAYGHTRNSSIGSSVWAGRGAHASSNDRPPPDSSLLPPYPSRRATPPVPALPTSSIALQQLRDPSTNARMPHSHLAVEATSALLHSAYHSPTPSENGQERSSNNDSIQVDNEEFDIVNPLRLKSPASFGRRGSGASPRSTLSRLSGSPRMESAELSAASPSGRQDQSRSSTTVSQRRRRSPILSFDGAVAEEEALLRLTGSGQAGNLPLARGEMSSSTDVSGSRRISHLGPRLRKNEPAPWEIEAGEAERGEGIDHRLSPGTTTGPSTSPSPWAILTRGAGDQADQRASSRNRKKSAAGLTVNVRRPSGADITVHGGPKSRVVSGEGDFGSSKPRSTSSGAPSPSIHYLASPVSPVSYQSRGSDSVGEVALGSPRTPIMIPRGNSGDNSPRVLHDRSSQSTHSRSDKKATSGSSGRLRGLGLGPSSGKASRQSGPTIGTSDTNDASGSRLNSKLAKAFRIRGDREDAALAKGISSHDYVKVAEGIEPAQGNSQPRTASDRVRSPSVASMQRGLSLETARVSNWRAAEANKGLVNPFANLPTTMVSNTNRGSSETTSVSSAVPLAPNRTTSRAISGRAASVSKSYSEAPQAHDSACHPAQDGPLTPQAQPSMALNDCQDEREREQPAVAPTAVVTALGGATAGSHTHGTGERDSAAVVPDATYLQSVSRKSAPTASPSVPTSPASSAQHSAVSSASLQEPAMFSSTKSIQRGPSLLSNSVTTSTVGSIASASNTMSNPTSLSSPRRSHAASPPLRGIGVAYLKSSGFTSVSSGAVAFPSASPRSKYNTHSVDSAHIRLGEPDDDSTTHRVAVSQPDNPLLHPSASSRELATAGAEGKGLHQLDKSDETMLSADSRITPLGFSATLTESSTDTSGPPTAATSVSMRPMSSRGSVLPTPGSHEGVAYKLISLEEAQAQRVGRSPEPPRSQRSESRADIKGVAPDCLTGMNEPAERVVAGAPSNRVIRGKKSGLLRMFGRNKGGDSAAREAEPSPEEVPSVPALSNEMRESLQTQNPSYGKPASSPIESLSRSASSAATVISLQETEVPALGALRPMSSIFASLSPVLGSVSGGTSLETRAEEDEDLNADAVVAGPIAVESKADAGSSVTDASIPPRSLRPDGFGGLIASSTAKYGELASVHSLAPSPVIMEQDKPVLRRPSTFASVATCQSDVLSTPEGPILTREHSEGVPSTPNTSVGISQWIASEARPEDAEVELWLSGSRLGTKPLRLSSNEQRREIAKAGISAPQSPRSQYLQAEQRLPMMSRTRNVSSSTVGSHTAKDEQKGPGSPGRAFANSSPIHVQGQLRDRILVIESRMSELVAELIHLRTISGSRPSTPASPNPGGMDRGSDPGEEPICNTIGPCSSCGCDCAELKRQEALGIIEALLDTDTRSAMRTCSGTTSVMNGSQGASVMDRGRGVKKRIEDVAGRFGGGP